MSVPGSSWDCGVRVCLGHHKNSRELRETIMKNKVKKSLIAGAIAVAGFTAAAPSVHAGNWLLEYKYSANGPWMHGGITSSKSACWDSYRRYHGNAHSGRCTEQ